MSYSNSSNGGEVVINTNMDNYTDNMRIRSSGKNEINFNRDVDGITRNIFLPQGGVIETSSSPSMMPVSIILNVAGEKTTLIQDFRIENLENDDAPYMRSDHTLEAEGDNYQIYSYLNNKNNNTSALLEIEGQGKGKLKEEFEAWSKNLVRFLNNPRSRFESGYSNISDFKAEGSGTAYFYHQGINVDITNKMKLNQTKMDITLMGRYLYCEGISNW